MRILVPLSCALLAALAGTAQGAFVSFASDSNALGPTFQGSGAAGIRDGGAATTGGKITVTLLVDLDEDGPNAATSVVTDFTANMTLSNNSQQALLGGGFIHGYRAAGFYEFKATGTNTTILRVDFSNAYLASISSVATALGSSASLQANTGASTISVTTGGVLAGLGVMPNFGFTLTNLQGLGGTAVGVSPTGAITADTWRSEGSYSGRIVVPNPGSFALMGLGGLMAARRRR